MSYGNMILLIQQKLLGRKNKMNIGIDIDGVLMDDDTYRLDTIAKYCYENNLGTLENPYKFEDKCSISDYDFWSVHVLFKQERRVNHIKKKIFFFLERGFFFCL